MKKLINIFMVIAIILFGVGCSSSNNSEDPIIQDQDFTLNLIVVNYDEDSKTIEAAETDNPEEVSYVISFEDQLQLNSGDQIAVVADVIMESYPAQVNAKSVAVTSPAQEPSTCIEAKPASFELVDRMNLPEGLKVDENHKESGYDFIEKDDANFLILYMGERNTGGYGIRVTDILKVADEYLVLVEEKSPAPGDIVTMAFTYPYTVVKLDKEITEDMIKIERSQY
ncbi:protease complex subunit PrcB family protein [Acidaminobacter sp. JC074]|uniref:protease complex subunit PrcB family protein n=1 Tax=Acidaminobacter sp. JC074 TaxID=2530199 RepID=UPI001F0DCA22|nr:protease complex subunit PrcB family protein [Acidaminobacter sp. JC074]MCH4888502.1 protease complex subunit PrcB family protein [Acidaminobacter sp. JC074]